MNLENKMPSERNQTQKATYFDSIYRKCLVYAYPYRQKDQQLPGAEGKGE